MRPSYALMASKEIPNPERPSWWADFGRQSFTRIAEGELPRMRSSKFSVLNRTACTGDEPTRPSSISLYKQAKRLREMHG